MFGQNRGVVLRRSAWLAMFSTVAIASVAAIEACSTFGSDDTAVADAGDEAGQPSDGGGEADADAGAEASFGDSSCSWFCESFDEPDGWPGPGWGPLEAVNGGVIGVVDATFVSPPRSLRATLGSDAGANASASAPRTYFGAFAEVRCTMRIKAESIADDFATIVELDLGDADGGGTWTTQLSLNAISRETELQENTAPDFLPLFPLGEWLLVGVDIRLGTGTRVTINGLLQNHPTASPAADAGARTFSSAMIGLGALRTGGTQEWRIDFDDVACDLLP
jgi:hypothetical protein